MTPQNCRDWKASREKMSTAAYNCPDFHSDTIISLAVWKVMQGSFANGTVPSKMVCPYSTEGKLFLQYRRWEKHNGCILAR